MHTNGLVRAQREVKKVIQQTSPVEGRMGVLPDAGAGERIKKKRMERMYLGAGEVVNGMGIAPVRAAPVRKERGVFHELHKFHE